MVIVKIVGGLGNQMFCYAYAKALEARGYLVKIDVSVFEVYKAHRYLLDEFAIDLPKSTSGEKQKFISEFFISRALRKIGLRGHRHIKQSGIFFEEELLNPQCDSYIEGYFLSDKYFDKIGDTLRDQFVMKRRLTDYSSSILSDIKRSGNKSCSIHVRRGDYLEKKNNKVHGICDLDYYIRAVEFLEKKNKELRYYVFSDDIGWCKEHFSLDNAVFVDGEGHRAPHEDLLLMSACSKHIIANSTFSWWGAWLDDNDQKDVIAPENWLTNYHDNAMSDELIPKSWKRL